MWGELIDKGVSKMTRQDCDLYIELAELVRANVSGPVKHRMVAKAQKRLVQRMRRNGTLSDDEAEALSM